MDCPKGCRDLVGRPVQMRGGGKIVARKDGQYERQHCPKCWHKEYVKVRVVR
jgi:hypothetical protein